MLVGAFSRHVVEITRWGETMWTWLTCLLIGHEYSVHCEQGAVYLRCMSCGRRSHGWTVEPVSGHHG